MEYKLANGNIENINAEDLYNYGVKSNENILTRFLSWCTAQEDNKFLWLGITFFGQIGVTLPITVYCINFFGGNNMLLWIIACMTAVPALILNLGAAPTKITLPVLFFSWFTQLMVILYCISLALMG